MKKVLTVTLCLVVLASGAVSLTAQERDKLEKFTSEELGISFDYPSFFWQVFLDRKKIDGYFINDFVVMKKKSAIEHMKFHALLLVKPDDHILKFKKFRDAILKDRITKTRRSRGIVNRRLTAEENALFGSEEGHVMAYEYLNSLKQTSTIYLYFMKKGDKLFAIEYLADKKIPIGHVPEKQRNAPNPALAEMQKVIESVRLK